MPSAFLNILTLAIEFNSQRTGLASRKWRLNFLVNMVSKLMLMDGLNKILPQTIALVLGLVEYVSSDSSDITSDCWDTIEGLTVSFFPSCFIFTIVWFLILRWFQGWGFQRVSLAFGWNSFQPWIRKNIAMISYGKANELRNYVFCISEWIVQYNSYNIYRKVYV